MFQKEKNKMVAKNDSLRIFFSVTLIKSSNPYNIEAVNIINVSGDLIKLINNKWTMKTTILPA